MIGILNCDSSNIKCVLKPEISQFNSNQLQKHSGTIHISEHKSGCQSPAHAVSDHRNKYRTSIVARHACINEAKQHIRYSGLTLAHIRLHFFNIRSTCQSPAYKHEYAPMNEWFGAMPCDEIFVVAAYVILYA